MEERLKVYIGIDPGKRGFISVMSGDGIEFLGLGGRSGMEVSDFMGRYSGVCCHAVMEDVHAVYGSSAGATFEFGFGKGFLLGLLVAHRIPYTLVQPKEWQAGIWTNADMVVSHKVVDSGGGVVVSRRVTDTKATSIKAASRIFPAVDFRKSGRCRRIDDNKVDSLLMAEYARRRNL